MRVCKITILTALATLLAVQAAAQNKLFFRGYYGYYVPRMGDVNDRIERQIAGWQDLLGIDIPVPGKINGDQEFGGKVQYHLSENQLLGMQVAYYEEQIASRLSGETGITQERFLFERKVSLLNISLTLDYYFNFGDLATPQPYAGISAGVAFANARSNTVSTFTKNKQSGADLFRTDTQGDFSSSVLSGSAYAGMVLELFAGISLWTEAGLQFANVGQMDGKVRRFNTEGESEESTDSSFDFSGAFIRAGLGLGLPLGK